MSENQESQWCKFQSKSWQAQDPRRANVSVWVLRLLKTRSSSQARGITSYSAILYYSGLQLIRWGPPTLRRAIFFTQSTNSNVNLTQKHPHRCTQNNVWPKVWAPYGSVKLIHKINHHRWGQGDRCPCF